VREYEEKYTHKGWVAKFTGRESEDGWDDSFELTYHDGPTIYAVPFHGNNELPSKDEAIGLAMTHARKWIDTKSVQFLTEKRKEKSQNT